MIEISQQEQELEFDGDFDPEELEDSENEQNARYVFDPDTEQDEEILYDPARRKRRPKTKTRYRTRVVTKVRRAYRKARKRKKPAWMGWQTMMAIPVALVSFIVSMQQDTLGWFAEKDPTNIKNAFSIYEILKTLGGGWGRPKSIMDYIKNIFSSPLGLGGIALAVYALIPIKRLPLKRIALICGGALLIGSILGSALHASGEESGNPARSGISERQAYSHVLQNDPFNR